METVKMSPELPLRKGAVDGSPSNSSRKLQLDLSPTSSRKILGNPPAAPSTTGGTASTGVGAMTVYPKPAGRKGKYPDPDESDEEDPLPKGASGRTSLLSRMSARISSRIRG